MSTPPAHVRRLVVLLVFVALGLWYAANRHLGLYGDGPLFLEQWRLGVWVQAHFLPIPLAWLAQQIVSPFVEIARDEAIQLVSITSAAGMCALLLAVLWPATSTLTAFTVTALVALAPVQRFFAGAVEVHALSGLLALVAGLLAMSRAPSSRAALARTIFGYVLVSSAHITGTILGPALLLIHVGAQRRAGRTMGAVRTLVHGLVLLVAGLAVVGAIWIIDRNFTPEIFLERSAVQNYIHAMVAWDRTVPRPGLVVFFQTEIAAALGPLLPAALVGVVPLARRRPWTCAGLLAWVAGIAFCSVRVGAREHGAYAITALPALAWLAAEGIQWIVAGKSTRVLGRWIAWLGVILCFQVGLAAWAHESGLVDPARMRTAYHVARNVEYAEVAFVWPPEKTLWVTLLPSGIWYLLGTVLALVIGIGSTRPSDATSRASGKRLAWMYLPCLAAIALQWIGSETFARRWPILWNERLADACRQLREIPEEDLLLHAIDPVEAKWTLNHYYGRPWLDLFELDALGDSPAARRWVAYAEEEMRRTRAAGGRVLLHGDGLAWLIARNRVRALLEARAWIDQGDVEPVPATQWETKSVLERWVATEPWVAPFLP